MGAGKWVRKADFGGAARYGAVGFSIGNKGYVGLGASSLTDYYKDFWEYDPSTNTWTQKADFGGETRERAVGFSIGNKGYVGTGLSYNVDRNNTIADRHGYYRDFWEYNPSTNTWTRKADFRGVARYGAVGFSIGNKGYIGTGFGGYETFYKDFWEYDPSTNTWTQKADFRGMARSNAVGFSIGNKGYIGTGYNSNSNYLKDFWEYDPSTNTWTQKADFGGTARYCAVGFSIGNKGYIGTGYGIYYNFLKDFWEYDPSTNTWTQKADFGGTARCLAVGFSIGNKGYIGTGFGSYQDFWEFSFLPAVQTTNATNVTDTMGTLNGNLQDLGDYSSVSCYFKYRSSSDSQWTNTPAQNMASPGTFFYTLTGLQKGTTYYFKAVAECSDGVEEGEILSFSTIGVTTGVWNSGTAWTQKANFAGTARLYATGFSVSGKGYIGLGWNGSNYLNDFFEYNPSTNSWSQKANFPGGGRIGATGFSVGTKGYISCGQLSNGSCVKDLWEYNPSTNTWTQKADFGGTARYGAVGFSVGNKGYLGMGRNTEYSGFFGFSDFWEYNPNTNTWTRKADFAGEIRTFAVGFSIRDKGYVGTGGRYTEYGTYDYLKDFWEYDPSTNTWTRKADFGSYARYGAVGFSIGDKGYLGTGYGVFTYYCDFWEYDPSTNTWTRRDDFFIQQHLAFAVGFSIGSKGYVGTGASSGAYRRDFYQFDSSANTYIGATNVTQHTARLNGTLNGLGKDGNGNNYTFNCYFRYRKLGTQNWNFAAPKVVKNSTGSYYIDVLALESDTTYEFQAMVECPAGIYYADSTLTFTTLKAPATIQTNDATNVSYTSATLNGEVVSLGDYESLMCYFNWRQKNTETWNTTSPAVEMSGLGVFDYALSGLDSGKTYEFRAVGQYGSEYFYGDIKEFTTSGTALPIVETEPATNIRKDSATLNGELVSLGDYTSADCFFQYRVKGQTNWIETSPKETKTSPGTFSKSITGLTRRYVYEYRAVAETTGGRVYGTIKSFEAETWIFDHWEGDVTGSENPKTITMNKSKNVRAVFIREP